MTCPLKTNPNLERESKDSDSFSGGRSKESGPYWIEYYADGRQIRESAKSPRYGDAQALLRRRLTEIEAGTYAGPQAARVQVTALLGAVLHDYEDKEQVVERALHADKRLREFFGAFRASRVETATLHSYVKHRRTAGVSNATINRELALLRRAFNLAKKSTPPQVNRVPVFPILKEAPP